MPPSLRPLKGQLVGPVSPKHPGPARGDEATPGNLEVNSEMAIATEWNARPSLGAHR